MKKASNVRTNKFVVGRNVESQKLGANDENNHSKMI